jgi:hypothetical protein
LWQIYLFIHLKNRFSSPQRIKKSGYQNYFQAGISLLQEATLFSRQTECAADAATAAYTP